jgi:hypothetical protein
MSTEFGFVVMDANQRVEAQQSVVRKIVGQKIDLDEFRRHSPLPLPPPIKAANGKHEEPEEDTAA